MIPLKYLHHNAMRNGASLLSPFSAYEGKTLRIQKSNACYAALCGGWKDLIIEIVVPSKASYKEQYSETKLKNYFDFMVNRSWFKDVFITKDFEEAKEFGVQINPKSSHSTAFAGITAMREFWETGYSLGEAYDLLVNNGFEETFSFFAMRFFRRTSNGKWQFNTSCGHLCINPVNVDVRSLFKEGIEELDQRKRLRGNAVYSTLKSNMDKVTPKKYTDFITEGYKKFSNLEGEGWCKNEVFDQNGVLSAAEELRKIVDECIHS